MISSLFFSFFLHWLSGWFAFLLGMEKNGKEMAICHFTFFCFLYLEDIVKEYVYIIFYSIRFTSGWSLDKIHAILVVKDWHGSVHVIFMFSSRYIVVIGISPSPHLWGEGLSNFAAICKFFHKFLPLWSFISCRIISLFLCCYFA